MDEWDDIPERHPREKKGFQQADLYMCRLLPLVECRGAQQ